jgi:hypothetical protein
MNIAQQIDRYEKKGFSREQAEINTIIENAILAIFKDFPDAFLLFGGATLVLFHESVRHSADLDLLARHGIPLPTREEIIGTLKRELSPIADILELGELQFGTLGPGTHEGSIFVATLSGQRLFRVDLTKLGSAIESEIETHPIEAQSGEPVVIRSANKELLLLQKAEAFLLRRVVKARDAYDIAVLLEKGAALNSNLRAHLADAVYANEIDEAYIAERIAQIDADRCSLELNSILPPEVYSKLKNEGFATLRDAVATLYKVWL